MNHMINLIKKKYLTHLIFISNLLVIPFYLTGPFLPDLCVSFSSLMFVIYILANKEFNYFNNNFTKIFLFFYIYILARSLLSVNVSLSLESSLFYIRFLLFSLSIILCLNIYKKFKYFFLIILIFTYSFLIFDAFFQLFNGVNIFGLEREVPNRISAIFGEELILGSFLSRTLPIIIAFVIFINFNYKLQNIILASFIGLSAIIIFITGERVAFFNFIFFIFLFLIIVRGFGKLKLAIISIGPLIIVATIFFYPIFYERMVNDTLKQIGVNSETKYLISQYHQPLYETGYKMYIDNKIFGHGPKLFRYLCSNDKYIDEYSCNTHPHNTYIQLLAETGIIGFAFVFSVFLFLAFYFLKGLYGKIIKKNNKINIKLYNETSILVALVIINLWPLAPTGNFFNNWLSILYYLPVGFLIYNLKLLNNER